MQASLSNCVLFRQNTKFKTFSSLRSTARSHTRNARFVARARDQQVFLDRVCCFSSTFFDLYVEKKNSKAKFLYELKNSFFLFTFFLCSVVSESFTSRSQSSDWSAFLKYLALLITSVFVRVYSEIWSFIVRHVCILFSPQLTNSNVL